MMEKVSLDCGSVHFDDDLSNQPRSKTSRDFAQRLIVGMCQKSARFFDADKREYTLRDYPLRWNEATFGSSLAAALDEITPVHLSEEFVARSRPRSGEDVGKRMSRSGRADFWCWHHDCEFLIETKRARYAWRTREINTDLEEKWDGLTGQLLDQKKDAKKWRTHPVRLGLMPVFTFQKFSKKQIDNDATRLGKFSNELIEEDLEYLKATLKRGPKLWGYWRLPQRMRLIDISDDQTQFEYTPAIFFLCRLETYDGKVS